MPSIIKLPQRRNPEGDSATATRPENATSGFMRGYTLFQSAAFMLSGFSLLFVMCMAGRPGA